MKASMAAARAALKRPKAAAQPETFWREFTTPEGARLSLKIASAGERAGAFTIDFILLILTLMLGGWVFSMVFEGAGWDAERIGGAMFGIFVFVVRNFYFIAFEAHRFAATPGKRVLGLRVASRDGGRLSSNAVFARNLVREIEVFMPIYLLVYMISASVYDDESGTMLAVVGLVWTLVFILFPLFNRDRLRLGDLIAGTWVVHVPKPVLMKDVVAGKPSDAVAEGDFAFTPQELAVYGIHELQVLEGLLRTSTPEVRSAVADRIRRKIGRVAVPGEDDQAFLNAFYATLRQHLESGLAMGRRKRDKFDKG